VIVGVLVELATILAVAGLAILYLGLVRILFRDCRPASRRRQLPMKH